MSKHTPGPWKDKRLYPDTLYLCHVMIEPSVAGLWAPPGNTVAEANAALIAAAPDLLEMLKELRESVTDAYKSGRIPAEPFVRAGLVIAKAEGR